MSSRQQPNFDVGSVSHGGYLHEILKPWIRFFPRCRKKRRVRVCAYQYSGLGVHWYVTLREEDNLIWDRKGKTWRKAWDDKEAGGHSVSKRFSTKLEVDRWVKKMRNQFFPVRTHVLVEDFTDKRWHYKEGD